jgi:Zn finger protein HypA/HybF involved in hydrogenase expression
MTEARLHDRRFRVSGPRLRPECRLCWHTVDLGPEHVEATQQHVYVRCPNCGGSFPIRHSDIETLQARPQPLPG